VFAWGGNSYGQLGNGTTNPSDVPVEVKLPPGTTVTAVAAAYSHSVALTSTGAMVAWGDNTDGELGDGTHTNRELPVEVKAPKNTKAVRIAAGAFYSLARTSTGALLSWGAGSTGVLGDGTFNNSDRPVHVKLPTGDKVTAMGAGSNAFHCLAVVRPT
jgi:alpha-tubulin suppressor-like RCC1 family protein